MIFFIPRNIKGLLAKSTVAVLVLSFLAAPVAPVFADIENPAIAPVTAIGDISVLPSQDMAHSAIDSTPTSAVAETLSDTSATNPIDPSAVTENPATSQNAATDSSVPPAAGTDSTVDPVAPAQSVMAPTSPSDPVNGFAPVPTNSSLSQKLPEIDKNTGALNYNYPISVPPGRNNLHPDLNLSYNSSLSNNNSIFGFGWTLNIPYVQRLNKVGSDKLYDSSSNYFYSSLDGELIKASGSLYVPKVENGRFNKYTFFENKWLVVDKSGVQYMFGYDTASQQNDPANPDNVYKWMLQEIRDANDNYISYAYFKDAGQIYPSVVKYTGNGSTDGIFEVDFQRAVRTDNSPSFNTGFSVVSNYYISEINAKVNGSLATKYALSYAVSNNSNRSLLKSITMSGQDSNGNITNLPPATFDYQSSGSGWTAADSYWNFPNPDSDFNVASNRNNLESYFPDLNADGLPDLVTLIGRFNTQGAIYQYKIDKEFLNTGRGWTAQASEWALPGSSSWNLPSYLENYGLGEIYFPDLNADGLPDLVERIGFEGWPPDDFSGVPINYVYINNGHGWSQAPSSWGLPNIPPEAQMYRYQAQKYFTDINADGLSDFIQIIRYDVNPNNSDSSSKFKDLVYINNGSGWTEADSSWNLEPINIWLQGLHSDNSTARVNLKFSDLNGDGLLDVVVSHEGNIMNGQVWPAGESSDIYINNGRGWTVASSQWNIPSTSNPILSLQFVDFNNDGLPDLFENVQIQNTYQQIGYANNGNGWNVPLVSFGDVEDKWILVTPSSMQVVDSIPQFSDINGDGLEDFIEIKRTSDYGVNIDAEYLNTGPRQDLLSQITYPQGGSTAVTYKTTAQYADELGNPANKSPYQIFTVSQILTNDGFGNNISSSYQYAGGRYYYNNPTDREFAGYNIISKTDSAGNITKTYYHTANESDSSRGEYNDDYWKIGKAYRTEQYDNAGRLFTKTINKWDDVDLGSGSKFAKLAQTVNSIYDGNASHRDTAERYTYDDANGNLVGKIQYGLVQGNNDGTFTDVGIDIFTTALSYATNLATGVIGLSSQSTTADAYGKKVKESKFYYDLQPQGSVTKGNPTMQEDWVAGTSYVASQKTYNGYGLVTSSTDARGKITAYAYDAYNLYPAAITNALGHITQYAYNYASGQVVQKIDPNTRVFQYEYDGFGRLLKEKQPNPDTPQTLIAKTTYVYTDTPLAASIKKSNWLDGVSSVDSYVYVDGLGRKIQERQEAEGTNFSVKDTAYNNMGQVSKESLPYFSTGLNKTSPTQDGALYTNYTYDAMGRVVVATNIVGTTTNTYDDWQSATIDANGKQKDFYRDAYNHLIRVGERNGANIYLTSYSYDYSGNVIKTTDAASNIRHFSYDGLGRRLIAEDLHGPTDATFGIRRYTYDPAGNIIQTNDRKNQIVNYTYDDINRPLNEDFAGQAGIEVTYSYDTGVDGIGRLAAITSPGMTQGNTYNALGLLIAETKNINARNYLERYDYDWQGNQIIVINPDYSRINNIYNSAGLLEKTQRKEGTDANFIDVVSGIDYSPTGQIATINYANGVSTINTYDPARLYRLTNKVTTIAGGSRGQDLAYTYDTMGNITKIIDASSTSAAKISDYVYDDLYRLLSATITSPAAGQTAYTQTFSYDAIGNMLKKTETIGTTPATTYTYAYAGTDYTNPQAVTSISDGVTTTNYTYDANGNLITEGSKAYIFDYNDRLVQVSIPGTAPVTATTTFYPTTGDGFMYYNTSNAWSTAHDAPAATSASNTTTMFYVGTGKDAINYYIARSFLPFNTAALPDNATITGVKLKVYVDSKLNGSNDGNDWVSVVQGTQPITTSLTAADYDLAGAITNPQEGLNVTDRKDITSVVAGQYLDFGFNATGKKWISKTGVTKLALREGHDALNTAFVGSAGQYNRLAIRSSKYTATTTDPVLQVTYTVPPPPTVIKYAYDPVGQRVKVTNTNTNIITAYPTKFYNIDNAPTPKTTKHIFAGSQDLATIEGTATSAAIYYTHPDFVNSSSLMTDSAGAIAETMDYFPFGKIRIDEKAAGSTFNEQRKYIGQEFDADTGLNYLDARYYNSTIGRFISQDPMFWALPKELLADPQQLNSYSYARNNPIVGSDPSGLKPEPLEAAQMNMAVYQDGHEGEGLSGGWGYIKSLTGGDGMKMGIYSRTQTDTQCVPLEYALVSRGTRGFLNASDWQNNFQQPFGKSSDMDAAKTQALKFVGGNSNNEITFVGHSKGGPEAELGAVLTSRNAILFNPAAANLSAYGLDSSKNTSQISTYIVNGEILNSTEGLVLRPAGNVTYLRSQHSLPSIGRLLLGPIMSFGIDTYNSIQNHYMSSVISGLNGK